MTLIEITPNKGEAGVGSVALMIEGIMNHPDTKRIFLIDDNDFVWCVKYASESIKNKLEGQKAVDVQTGIEFVNALVDEYSTQLVVIKPPIYKRFSVHQCVSDVQTMLSTDKIPHYREKVFCFYLNRSI